MSQTFENLKAAVADHYTIEREIGSGGMATVYLAHDIKHDRNVAVKVLRPELAAALGPERFVREIRIAARLTHPHILPLHDSGEANGFLYYVMPYIDGESLRARIEREGELPVHDAAKILAEIVDALSYAHEQGIVHRDIKPDNVLMSGQHALVTDFGVAKAVSEATGRQELTTAGVALGTPSYMSPEQAAANPHIDHRTDIYAIGAMAYELLSGRPPFEGATPQAILAAHVMEPPDQITKHRAAVSPAMADLVMKCLEKKPADRWQSSAEMLPVLQSLSTPSGGMTPTQTHPMPSVQTWDRRKIVGAGVVAVAGVLALAFGLGVFDSDRPALTIGQSTRVTRDLGIELYPSLSPDGSTVAYSAGPVDGMRLFVRQLAGGGTIALTENVPGNHHSPQWSPDASQLMYASRGEIFVVPVFGGTPRRLAAPGSAGVPEGYLGNPVWSPTGDRVAFVWQEFSTRLGTQRQPSAIYIQPVDVGPADKVADLTEVHSLRWSPDGSNIVFVSGASLFVNGSHELGNVDPSSIGIVPVGGGDVVEVTAGGFLNVSPVWAPDGSYLLFVSNRGGNRDVYQIAIDGNGGPRGEAVPITTGIDAHTIDLSADGSLFTYSEFRHIANIWSLDIPTQTASVSDAHAITNESQVVETAQFSPDGRWIIYDSNREGNQDIYRIPAAGGEPQRLTTDPNDDYHPNFSPDGSEIAFYSLRGGSRDIFVMGAEGEAVQRLTSDSAQDRNPTWAPDGNALIFSSDRTGRSELYIIRRDGKGVAWTDPEPLTTGGGFWARWSPVTGQVVYQSDPTNTIRILDPASGESRRVAPGESGVSRPEWSSDGTTVYYGRRGADDMFIVWSVPAAGGTPREVVRFDSPERRFPAPNLGVTENQFLFFINQFESDVWVVELRTP